MNLTIRTPLCLCGTRGHCSLNVPSVCVGPGVTLPWTYPCLYGIIHQGLPGHSFICVGPVGLGHPEHPSICVGQGVSRSGCPWIFFHLWGTSNQSLPKHPFIFLDPCGCISLNIPASMLDWRSGSAWTSHCMFGTRGQCFLEYLPVCVGRLIKAYLNILPLVWNQGSVSPCTSLCLCWTRGQGLPEHPYPFIWVGPVGLGFPEHLLICVGPGISVSLNISSFVLNQVSGPPWTSLCLHQTKNQCLLNIPYLSGPVGSMFPWTSLRSGKTLIHMESK